MKLHHSPNLYIIQMFQMGQVLDIRLETINIGGYISDMFHDSNIIDVFRELIPVVREMKYKINA